MKTSEQTQVFITSMMEYFCDGCSWIRPPADGTINSRLHHPAEVDLRTILRSGTSDDELITLIRRAVWQKPQGHAPAEELVQLRNRTMIQIGG